MGGFGQSLAKPMIESKREFSLKAELPPTNSSPENQKSQVGVKLSSVPTGHSIAYMLWEPFHLLLDNARDSDVAHYGIGRRAVPMVFPRQNLNDIAH